MGIVVHETVHRHPWLLHHQRRLHRVQEMACGVVREAAAREDDAAMYHMRTRRENRGDSQRQTELTATHTEDTQGSYLCVRSQKSSSRSASRIAQVSTMSTKSSGANTHVRPRSFAEDAPERPPPRV